MKVISRRTALTGAGVGTGMAAASILMPTAAMADGYKYQWKRTVQPGQTIEEIVDDCKPDQVVQAKWLYDYSQAPASLYITTAVRQEGKTCYRALVHNAGGKICLRLERCDAKGATILAQGPSVPISSYVGRRPWVLRTTITGNQLEAVVDGVDALKLSTTDDTIKEGTHVSQTYYLSKQAKAATDVRGNSLKVSSSGSATPQGYSKLVFEDTFSTGTDLDTTKWGNHWEDWNPGYRSYDWSMVTHDTHDVKDGQAHIWWRKRAVPVTNKPNKTDQKNGVSPTVRDVDTASVVSRGKFAFTYGRVETRIRFPQSHAGLWGGFWLRPVAGGDGEIDVVESWGGGAAIGKATFDVHYTYDAVKYRHNPVRILPAPDLTQFHTYAMEKTPERITFYFDGRKLHEVLSTEYPDRWAKAFGPDKPYYLRMGSQAGDSPETKVDTTTFTAASMDVDYVRVWEMDR